VADPPGGSSLTAAPATADMPGGIAAVTAAFWSGPTVNVGAGTGAPPPSGISQSWYTLPGGGGDELVQVHLDLLAVRVHQHPPELPRRVAGRRGQHGELRVGRPERAAEVGNLGRPVAEVGFEPGDAGVAVLPADVRQTAADQQGTDGRPRRRTAGTADGGAVRFDVGTVGRSRQPERTRDVGRGVRDAVPARRGVGPAVFGSASVEPDRPALAGRLSRIRLRTAADGATGAHAPASRASTTSASATAPVRAASPAASRARTASRSGPSRGTGRVRDREV
jgi:hypothetical protein